MEAVFINVYQLATGFGVAIIVGFAMYFFRNFNKKVKAVVVLFCAFVFVILAQVTHFHEAKYIAVIVYGYMCFRMWGEDKPEHELATIW